MCSVEESSYILVLMWWPILYKKSYRIFTTTSRYRSHSAI